MMVSMHHVVFRGYCNRTLLDTVDICTNEITAKVYERMIFPLALLKDCYSIIY